MLGATTWSGALMVALVAAAAHPAGAGFRRPGAQSEFLRRELTLEVRNDNFFDATVYAIRPGLRQRLGFVGGIGKAVFRFRWPEGDLRVEIDFLAGGRYYSQVIDVRDGDELQLTILPYLHTLPPGTIF